ncbi:MAG TPA: PEP-CTERM sorting domain-containing protein [Gemmatales bacterium]|nr:PEP-CTERM sorting domain-containing protein [Gemmatales bacterium]
MAVVWGRRGIGAWAAMVLLGLASAASGQTVRTWENPVSDNFAVATRWTPVGKPTGTDSALFNAAGTYTINFTVNESFGALRIEGGDVQWSSSAARTVSVTSILVANNGTDWRLGSDVRVINSGTTTLNAANGTLVLNGGRLTTTSLQMTQGTLIGNNSGAVLTVTGAANIGGQGTFSTANLGSGMQVTFGGALSLAPTGPGSPIRGPRTPPGATTAAMDGKITVGNTTADNRQGIISVAGAGTTLTQSGSSSITIGRIQTGIPPSGFDIRSRIEVGAGGVVTTGTGIITLNNLGAIDVNGGGTFNANGSMTINAAGQLNVTGGLFNTTGNITVNAQGAVVHSGGAFARSGNILVNAGSFAQTGGSMGFTGSPNLTVQNGGTFSTTLPFVAPNGSVTAITGAGSTFQAASLTSGGGSGTQFNMTAGAVATLGGLTLGTAGIVTTIIDGTNTHLNAGGGPATLQAGSFTVRNAGRADLAATSLGNGSSITTFNVQTGGNVFVGSLNAATSNGAGAGANLNVTGSNSTFTVVGAGGFLLGGTTTGIGQMTMNTGGHFVTGTGTGLVNPLGTINVNAGGTFTANGPLLVEGGTIQASAGSFVFGSGAGLTLQSGAQGQFGTLTLNPGNTVTVDAAELRLANLTAAGGQVNFFGGLVQFTQNTNLTGGRLATLLGPAATLHGGRTLQVLGTATMQSQLVVDGGTFAAQAITGGSLIDLRRGTVFLNGSDLVVGSGGAFGSTVTVGNGAALQVQAGGNIFVNAGGLAPLPGGQLNSTGTISNQGEIQLAGPTARLAVISGIGSIVNQGLILGTGRVRGTFNNQAAGTVRVQGSDRLVIDGVAANAGTIHLAGGTVEFTGSLTNSSGGFITGRGAFIGSTATPGSTGLFNFGVLAFSAGTTDVFGDVQNSGTGQIITAGGATTTFFDDVTHNGAEIRTGAGARTVFLGAATGSGPFTGTGVVEFQGDLRPGNSPGLVSFGGDLLLGDTATLYIELGGLGPGSQYDALDVTGAVHLAGGLDIRLIDGFIPTAGNLFVLIENQGSDAVEGTFAGLAEGATFYADGHQFQITYQGGTGNDVVLTAVPEPTTLALVGLMGLAGAGSWWWRRQRTLEQEALTPESPASVRWA